ncbi:DUF5107 domain-containing protein [Nonomuraea thailandensis]
MEYGSPPTLLPYTRQEGYGRNRADRDHVAIVLENETLCATFLPEHGGRLWSLTHKPTGRDLLHRNPLLQHANLALRDAWFAGGVEWNLGTTGHWGLTSSPLHAARAERPVGTPVLRLYEFERMRRLVVQIDAYLPSGSPVLFVHIKLHNPHGHEVPVYWWSNLAVPETPDTRVLTPAEHAYQYGYGAKLRRIRLLPDAGYPARQQSASDHFFELDAGQPPWIAALDGDGRGIAHASTARLRGRKLFCWGTGPGGRHWQEWLSGPDNLYLEIQGGLARTQLEHLPISAATNWSWLEAFGMAEADPVAVHGAWADATAAAGDAVKDLIPPGLLEDELAAARLWHDFPPIEQLHTGSGWGALERAADVLPDLPAVPFGQPGPDQEPWLHLLKSGELPATDPPALPVIGQPWRRLLEQHVPDWHALLHLGLLRMADGDTDGAREAWTTSLSLRSTPWALRNLAWLEEPDERANLLLQAQAMLPRLRQLTVETLEALLAANRPATALDVIDSLDGHDSRVTLLECRAALAAGDLARAKRLLDDELQVPDLGEGEDDLSELWQAVHGRDRPIPPRYDFRMR